MSPVHSNKSLSSLKLIELIALARQQGIDPSGDKRFKKTWRVAILEAQYETDCKFANDMCFDYKEIFGPCLIVEEGETVIQEDETCLPEDLIEDRPLVMPRRKSKPVALFAIILVSLILTIRMLVGVIVLTYIITKLFIQGTNHVYLQYCRPHFRSLFE